MLSSNKDINKDMGNSIKDTTSPSPFRRGQGEVGSYTKTNKLITALYMVTDIMDRDEPIRNKLRTLGTEIISDPEGPRMGGAYGAGILIQRVEQAMSFLDIASAMNLISEMNSNILKKEFLELKESIQEHMDIKPTWLTEFLAESESIGHDKPSIGHQTRTRIGVQKGSTLLKALSDKTSFLSPNTNHLNSRDSSSLVTSRAKDFDMIKKERRFNIIKILKNNGGSTTIKDIRTKINDGVHQSLACSEKTLQRELVSMTKDGVLNKTGEKRWSRYLIRG